MSSRAAATAAAVASRSADLHASCSPSVRCGNDLSKSTLPLRVPIRRAEIADICSWSSARGLRKLPQTTFCVLLVTKRLPFLVAVSRQTRLPLSGHLRQPQVHFGTLQGEKGLKTLSPSRPGAARGLPVPLTVLFSVLGKGWLIKPSSCIIRADRLCAVSS